MPSKLSSMPSIHSEFADRRLHHGADHSVETRSITAAG
jgi:hypothetical protein